MARHVTGRTAESAVRLAIAVNRRYTRLEVEVDEPLPDGPALVVGNHGFGALTDLNVLALLAALQDIDSGRPTTYLVHDLAWTVGVGGLLEQVGARRASPETTKEALVRGDHVVVFPGGDKEAGKDWRRRNKVEFHGRTGFARIAQETGVPIVPIVTAGAGESLLVLSDGGSLAKGLLLDRLFRCHALPISVSIPWGVTVGVAGLLPYVPLPTKLRTAVLAPVTPQPDETAEELARRVETVMQARMTRMTEHRRLLRG